MLEGIKILAERILAMPQLYDCQPRVMEIKVGDPEVDIESQIQQLIKIVYDNEHGIFTDEEINHIKQAEREVSRRVFNSWLVAIVAEQSVSLPDTREQRKTRLEIAEEEQRWRMEREKEKRQTERERQLAYEQAAQQREVMRYGKGLQNSLTGGLL
jgi:hypothetical protein